MAASSAPRRPPRNGSSRHSRRQRGIVAGSAASVAPSRGRGREALAPVNASYFLRARLAGTFTSTFGTRATDTKRWTESVPASRTRYPIIFLIGTPRGTLLRNRDG